MGKLLCLALFACSVSLFAQNPPPALAVGAVPTVRISDVTPNSTPKGFMEAVACTQGTALFP